VLTLPYSEHLGAAYGAGTLSCRFTILHSYASGILHFPLGAALHAVGLHLFTSLFGMKNKLFLTEMSTIPPGHNLLFDSQLSDREGILSPAYI